MRNWTFALAMLALSGCASGAASGPPQRSDDLMSGGQYLQPWLGQLIKEAENHPLGSAKNPVRSDMPRGEQAYLRRLRCADGKAPHFAREGNLGEGVYGSIVDAYRVRCVDSSPAESEIIMDMYFPEYQEKQAPPGFTIVSP